MIDIILNNDQKTLLTKLRYWFFNEVRFKPYFSYSGAAGTGKTTVITEFIREIGLTEVEYITAAFIGKAVLVLLRKGLNASTIHSLIYHTFFEPIPSTNSCDPPRLKLRFGLKERLSDLLKLIIIDEATMVNDKMKNEILSFGIPVVFIGDMNQLPPIFGVSSVMLKPDFILTELMRQSEDDPIVMFSQDILHDRPLIPGIYGDSKIVDYYPFDESLITDFDMIICGKNKTRDMFNTNIRRDILNRKSIDPIIGDKIICRQNNWDYSLGDIFLTNGLIGYITSLSTSSLYKGYLTIDFRPDFMEESFENLELDYKFIRLSYEEKNDYGMSRFNKFEYGYCITGHLSQGSEYDDVLFINEKFWNKELTKKLAYTAITRARKSITIVNNI